ncbi:endoglycoceramidase, partial [Streptomyces sp. SID7499]|nr:endoglycoceramidase [Streptomyces sp. SID7499]
MAVVVASVLAAGALAPAASARPVSAPVPASESRERAVPPLTDDRGRTLTLRGWNVEDKANR